MSNDPFLDNMKRLLEELNKHDNGGQVGKPSKSNQQNSTQSSSQYSLFDEDEQPKPKPEYTQAIHDALTKANDELQATKPKAPPEPVPTQFTLDEWERNGTNYGTPAKTGTEADSCIHDWQVYHGFNSSDIWCTKCNQKRPFDPSR